MYPSNYSGSTGLPKGGASGMGGTAGRAGAGGAGGALLGNSAGSSSSGGTASGGRASSDGGSSSKAGAGGAGAAPVCPSPTGVKLSNGTCVNRVTEFDVARHPTTIITGSDRKIWVDDDAANQLIQLDTDGKVLKRVDCDAGSSPRALIPGTHDAVLWYTDAGTRSLIKMTESDPKASVTMLGFVPTAIALGANDDIFISEWGKAIYRLLPNQTPKRWTASPMDSLVVTPDGNAWASEGTALAKLVPADGVKRVTLADTSNAAGLTVTSDALWYSDSLTDQLVRVSFDGQNVQPFNVQTRSAPTRLILGPDNALWFVEWSAQKIGRFDLKSGEVTHYSLPTQYGEPSGLTVGPDGNIWFTEVTANKVGRLIVDAQP